MIENLDFIKANIDIIEVLSNYLPLKKNGINYSCCCPFHTEKSGSFIVSPKKQLYHCFGCGAGGDTIKFLMEYKKLEFNEAILEIARLLNLPVVEKTYNYDKRKDYLNALEEYSTKAQENLQKQENQKIKQWLFNRGLEEEDLSFFEIGLAPSFYKQDKTLIELGVLFEPKGKDCGSLFANRILFPLRNAQHKIVGFSGRTHPYFNFKNTAKYINSKESKIFNKSQILYNLSRSKSAIIEQKAIIITEGFMDAIALYKMGFKNAVATCGTAFNATHLSQILRLREEVEIKFCFDKDEAGVNATLRAIRLLYSNGIFNAKVLEPLNACKDIGEILEKKETLDFKEMAIFEYYCDFFKRHLKTPKEKDNFINELKKIIADCENFYQKEELIQSASLIFELPKDFWIKKAIANPLSTKGLLELQLFKSVLNNPDCAYIAGHYLDGSEFEFLGADFKAFIINKDLTTKSRALMLDSSILEIDFSNFKNCLRAFLKDFYQRKLQTAKAKKDLSQILYLSNKINELGS